MRALPAALLVLASAALSAQAVPQEPRRADTSDRAGATAVVVDVVVRDSRGKPVVNLGPDDFEVYEDGVRQALGSFRPPIAASTTNAPAPTAPAAAATPAAKPIPKEPAVISVVFDRLAVDSRKLAVDAMRRYIGEGPQAANIVGVFDVDLTMRILQPFTQDAAALRESLARVSAARPTGGDAMHVTDLRGPMAQGLVGRPAGGRPADDLTIAMSAMTGDVWSSFSQFTNEFESITAVHSLAAIVSGMSRSPGRKSIIVFSEGIALTRENDPRFWALIDQANRANVALYTVDAAGLRPGSHSLLVGRYAADATVVNGSGSPGSPAGLADLSRSGPETGLGLLANETGGQLTDNSNDLFKAFPRLDEDLRSYYGLTYAPPRTEPDGKFHKIVVKVKRPGLSAKTRSGYTSLPIAAGSMPVLAYEAPALARLDSTPVPNQLPILARAFVFPVSHEGADVPLLVSIPSDVLDYARDEAAGTFGAEAVALVRVRDAEGRIVHKASEQYTLSGQLANVEASRRGELLFYRKAHLPPGVYTVEAVVLDSRSGKASVRVSSLEVPRVSPAALRVGSPFIVRRAESVAEADRDTTNPLFFGDVLLYPNLGQPLSKATDKELAFGFTAYDGHAGPVEATLQLLKSGQAVATLPLGLGSPDAQGRINQISKLPLEPLAPGAYELRVTVKAGGQQVVRAVPFAIAAS